jgi:hypothetical protein
MIEVTFEHWQYTFSQTILARYGSRYFSRKQAGECYSADIYASATRAACQDLQFEKSQLLCGNEAFPEAAVADPIADLETWEEWRSGLRDFPYPGRYSRLGITRQDDKTSSPSSVGVIGEIMAGFFAQVGVSPWVVVRKWPDFIFSHRDGNYSFVESKAFTGEPGGLTGLRSRVPNALVVEGAVDAAQQLNSDPFGKVWSSFTWIREITPFRLDITFLEFNVAEERRIQALPNRIMPASVADGLAERALNLAAAKREIRRIEDLSLPDLRRLAAEEADGLLDELGDADNVSADRQPIIEAIERIVSAIEKKKRRREEETEFGRERIRQAKEQAVLGRLAQLRTLGDQCIFLADLPSKAQTGLREDWSPNWRLANQAWGQIEGVPLWRCGGAVLCLGPGTLAQRELQMTARR